MKKLIRHLKSNKWFLTLTCEKVNVLRELNSVEASGRTNMEIVQSLVLVLLIAMIVLLIAKKFYHTHI